MYAFDIGNHGDLTNHFMNLFLESQTTVTVISHYCMPNDPDDLECIKLPFNNKISGSGEQHRLYIYKKKVSNFPLLMSPCPIILTCLRQDFLLFESEIHAVLSRKRVRKLSERGMLALAANRKKCPKVSGRTVSKVHPKKCVKVPGRTGSKVH